MVVHGAMGVLLWFALLKGGINADIAGVISALWRFRRRRLRAARGQPRHAMEPGMKVTLLDDLIHTLHPISSILIMPLFALANCAVPVNAEAMGGIMTTPVGTGIMFGLHAGKPLGIAGLRWLSTKVGMCSFPSGMNFKHLVTVGMLAGIGFTMSRSSSSRRSWACPSSRRRRAAPAAPPARRHRRWRRSPCLGSRPRTAGSCATRTPAARAAPRGAPPQVENDCDEVACERELEDGQTKRPKRRARARSVPAAALLKKAAPRELALFLLAAEFRLTVRSHSVATSDDSKRVVRCCLTSRSSVVEVDVCVCVAGPNVRCTAAAKAHRDVIKVKTARKSALGENALC